MDRTSDIPSRTGRAARHLGVGLAAIVLLLTGCAGGESESTEDAAPELAVADGVETEAADELAMTDTAADPTAEGSAASFGPIDDALAQVGECLTENGYPVEELSVASMMSRFQGDAPPDGDLVELFAFFVGADPTDPAVVEAVEACRPLVYSTPGLAAFLPPEDAP